MTPQQRAFDEYVASMPKVSVRVRRVTKTEARETRLNAREITKAFRKSAQPPRWYEVHHILPVSLGGSNLWTNLAAVHPDLHTAIHRYIDGQVRVSGRLMIPCLNDMVWHGPREVVYDGQDYRFVPR